MAIVVTYLQMRGWWNGKFDVKGLLAEKKNSKNLLNPAGGDGDGGGGEWRTV